MKRASNYIPALTGLRAVAVGMVLLSHAAPSMPAALGRLVPGASGDIGVQIFFVLSGYLITRLLMTEYAKTGTIGFWQFYRRRLYRITPAFYVFLMAATTLTVLGITRLSWQQLAVSAAYLWNYAHMAGLDSAFAAHPQGAWYLGHTWSLALEEQFYWVWPAAFLFISRRQANWVLPCIIFVVPLIRIATYFLEPSVRPQLHMMFHTGIDTILVGCFLAAREDTLADRFGVALRRPAYLTAAVVVTLLVLNLVQAHLGGLYIATYGATFGAAVIAFMMLAIIQQPDHGFTRFLCHPAIMYGGTISYSIYLWQQLFTNHTMPTGLRFPLNIAASVGMAAISYHFVEQPFLRLKDRTSKRREIPNPILVE